MIFFCIILTLNSFSLYYSFPHLFRTNLSDQHIEWDFEIPKLNIIGKYEVKGRVLILPLTGNGDANVTISM